MGYQFGTTCYSKKSDAENAYYTSQPMSQLPGSTTYRNYYKYSDLGNWTYVSETLASGGQKSVRYSSLAREATFPPCDESEQFLDGVMVGWGIVAAMAIAWGIRLMRHQLGVRS